MKFGFVSVSERFHYGEVLPNRQTGVIARKMNFRTDDADIHARQIAGILDTTVCINYAPVEPLSGKVADGTKSRLRVLPDVS